MCIRDSNKSDIVTSVSQSLKEDTYALFDTQKEIHVIPNFIELDKHRNEQQISCQRSVMASKDEKIITHISNFRKVKRIPDAVSSTHLDVYKRQGMFTIWKPLW